MPPKSQKLLKQMRQSQANWKWNDLISLYEGFGFDVTHGGSHDKVKHPDYPELRQTIPRHKTIQTATIRDAVQLIDRLLELQKLDEEDNQESDEAESDE